MNYEKYENWVKRQQENAVIWKKKGISVPDSENYIQFYETIQSPIII
jgi:hypothetical protein